MLSKFLIYTQFLNKRQAFFRPAPVSYKRRYYFKNQGLVFLKFMFLIGGTLLYAECPRKSDFLKGNVFDLGRGTGNRQYFTSFK